MIKRRLSEWIKRDKKTRVRIQQVGSEVSARVKDWDEQVGGFISSWPILQDEIRGVYGSVWSSSDARRGRSGKLYRARSRLYRNEILQENVRLKALAEIYTMHSFAQL